MNVRTLILLCAALPLACACSGLLESEQPAKQYWMLQPLEGVSPASPVSVEIGVVPGLDTDRIQALAHDASLHRYANARWADNLPEVLESVVSRSMGHPAPGDGGWKISLEFRAFFGRMNSLGETTGVSVEAAGFVECNGSRHALDTLDASPAVNSQNLSAIVAAHQAGLNEVTRELLTRLESKCS